MVKMLPRTEESTAVGNGKEVGTKKERPTASQ
jgi:hypothetical protein